MAKRGVVSDYAGEPLHKGDLINYAARCGNRVRVVDAVVVKATARKVEGRLRPMLLVEPTGVESGFAKRDSMRRLWVGTEHVRLIEPGYAAD
jgi:hypothetical protein